MLKAVREAKVHTSWLTPNQDYEEAVDRLRRARADRAGRRRFLPAVPAASAPDRRGSAGELARRRSRSRSARPACPTSTRAPSCGISAWSIPTTAGRWISSCVERMLDEVDEVLSSADERARRAVAGLLDTLARRPDQAAVDGRRLAAATQRPGSVPVRAITCRSKPTSRSMATSWRLHASGDIKASSSPRPGSRPAGVRRSDRSPSAAMRGRRRGSGCPPNLPAGASATRSPALRSSPPLRPTKPGSSPARPSRTLPVAILRAQA